MKRLWQRHRTWFLSVLSGLVTAVLLAWWFTPRPTLIVALPEIPDGMEDLGAYHIKDDDICIRAVAKRLSWVPIELKRDDFTSLPDMPEEEWIKTWQFVNVETGEVVAHPGVSPLAGRRDSANVPEGVSAVLDATTVNPLWFDVTGRFLVERRTFVEENIRQIDWFNPETKESGVIAVPGSHDPQISLDDIEEGLVDGLPIQTVSPDGTAVVDMTELEDVRVAIRIFDLRAEVWREQQSTLKDSTSTWDFYMSPSADKLAFYQTEPDATDIYEVSSGQWIDRTEGSIARLPGQWHSTTNSDFFRRYLFGEEQVLDTDGSRKLTDDGESWKIIEDPSVVVWSEDNLEVTDLKVLHASLRRSGAVSGPQLAPGQLGFVWATLGYCPGLLERWFQPLATAFGISLSVETPIGINVTWINWQTNERVKFRTESPEEELGGTFAIRPNCVCLLVNPKGPNPRVEVWSTPPPQRPVMAIWIVSLAVTIATWFRSRRRVRQSTSLANDAAATA